ncbi:MAG: hypothetical protein AB7F50_04030 [Fimbriimonadaceae bacterium]
MTPLVLAIALLAPPIELTLRPGAVHSYRLTRLYVTLDGTETTEFRESVMYLVGKEDPGVVTMRRRLDTLVVDGDKIALQGERGWTETSFGVGSDGTVWDRKTTAEEAPTLLRQLRPLELRLRGSESAPGSHWTVREGEDPNGAMTPAIWQYTVESATPRAVALKLAFAEDGGDPISGTGTVHLDPRTGWPVRQEITIQPTIQPGDEERLPCALKLTLVRR